MKIQSIMPLTMCLAVTLACNELDQQKSDGASEEKEDFDWYGEYEDKDEEDEDFDWSGEYEDKDDEYEEYEDKDEEYEDKDEEYEDKDEGYEDKDEEYSDDEKEEYGDEKEESEDGGECNNSSHSGFRTVVRAGETREFILQVPASYDASNPTPLVINFHGFGGCAADYANFVGNYYGLNDLADSENFIVAYPQGVARAKGSFEWDPGDNGAESIIDNDVFFAEALTAEISDELNVDVERVYAVGYSNGGMMAYGLACSSSDLIAASGVMSGIMLGSACDQQGSTSIIHFHGVADGALPYDGSGDFQSVASVVNIWLDHNDIPTSSLVTTQRNGGDVTHDVYSGGTQGTSVELYTIHREGNEQGGHVWFTEDIDGVSPNQILWDFLSSFTLD